MMYVLYVYVYVYVVCTLFLSYWAQLFMVDYQKSKQFFGKTKKYILNNKMM